MFIGIEYPIHLLKTLNTLEISCFFVNTEMKLQIERD